MDTLTTLSREQTIEHVNSFYLKIKHLQKLDDLLAEVKIFFQDLVSNNFEPKYQSPRAFCRLVDEFEKILSFTVSRLDKYILENNPEKNLEMFLKVHNTFVDNFGKENIKRTWPGRVFGEYLFGSLKNGYPNFLLKLEYEQVLELCEGIYLNKGKGDHDFINIYVEEKRPFVKDMAEKISAMDFHSAIDWIVSYPKLFPYKEDLYKAVTLTNVDTNTLYEATKRTRSEVLLRKLMTQPNAELPFEIFAIKSLMPT
jgi:hypothetical protein